MSERFVVAADLEGQRLDVALAAHLDVSRSRAAARISAGDVTVDGRVTAKQHRLRRGEQVEVVEGTPPIPAPAPALPPVRYQDEHVLVVAKPPGLVVHPGHGHPDGTLVDALRGAGIDLAPAAGEDRPGIVHRLDRDTSGLLVVARTDAAYHGLVDALARRAVLRRYVALVAGVPGSPRGRIEAPVGRDPRERTRFGVVVDGKPAVTRYRAVASGHAPGLPLGRREVSLLRCRLETGRTHQIRVHLTELGHPLAGDPVYGPRADLARALGLRRPALHAAVLAFDHPVTGARVRVTEPLPDDLVAALTACGIDPAAGAPNDDELDGPTA